MPFAKLGPRFAWEAQKKMEGTLLAGGPSRSTWKEASPLGIIPRNTDKLFPFPENAKKDLLPFEPWDRKAKKTGGGAWLRGY